MPASRDGRTQRFGTCMQGYVRRLSLLISILFLSIGCLTAALSIDHNAESIDWTDGSESWQYFLTSKDWSWDNGGMDTWTYTESTKTFADGSGGQLWKYESAYDVWVGSPAGTYDITTATSFNAQAWRHDDTTQTWKMVSRSTDGSVSFSTVSEAGWQYNTSTSKWEYSRTPVTGLPNVPTSQEWTFGSDTLIWTRTTPGGGITWNYNRLNAQWYNDTEDETWQFLSRADDHEYWQIIGEKPVGVIGAPWDRVQWRNALANGMWQSEEVKDGPPLVYGLITQYAFNSSSNKWVVDLNTDDAPDDGGASRELRPFFPPTPMAHFKRLMEASVLPLLTDGPTWGSTDGTGSGLLDTANDAYVSNGLFKMDKINKVTFVDMVKIKGDLEFEVLDDATLTLGDGTPTGDVTILPADDATHAQIVFNVATGKTLTINMLNDTSFLAANSVPLYLSFRGRGTTKFRLPSGSVLTFAANNPSTGTKGVHLQVLMEQTAADDTARKSQLCFAPWSYAQESGSGAINTNTSEATQIVLGRHCSLGFVSANAAGINEDTLPGYGSVAFDVAHEGVGRTILDLQAGASAGDLLDAGVNIYGVLITGTGTAGAIEPVDFRTGVTGRKLAGIRATLRITDEVALASIVPNPSAPTTEQATAWTARDATSRRGLAVISRNQSYPRLAANLEAADTLENSSWAQHTRLYHPGFILGTNGQIDIWHNLFLDYVAGSINRAITPTYLGGSGKTTADVKWRNPSALIVDRLGTYAASEDTSWDMSYVGTVNPRITLRGDAGVFARCGASSLTGALIAGIEEVTSSGPDKLDATVGFGTYNGVYIPVLASDGTRSLHETIALDAGGNPVLSDGDGVRCLDGEQAIIVEGPLTIRSILGRFGFAPNGYVNIPSIRLDHTGIEVGGVA